MINGKNYQVNCKNMNLIISLEFKKHLILLNKQVKKYLKHKILLTIFDNKDME
jgi:hypothetical protein